MTAEHFPDSHEVISVYTFDGTSVERGAKVERGESGIEFRVGFGNSESVPVKLLHDSQAELEAGKDVLVECATLYRAGTRGWRIDQVTSRRVSDRYAAVIFQTKPGRGKVSHVPRRRRNGNRLPGELAHSAFRNGEQLIAVLGRDEEVVVTRGQTKQIVRFDGNTVTTRPVIEKKTKHRH